MFTIDRPLQLIEPERFEIAFSQGSAHDDEEQRRFSTLLVDPDAVCATGSGGAVHRVHNAQGETFALKAARPLNAPETDARRKDIQQITFLEEYRNQLIVSNLKGFPRTYGYGTVNDAPFILMEWIEGPTLAQARRLLAQDGSGADGAGSGVNPDSVSTPINAQLIAQLGMNVVAVLARTFSLSSPFVHRDLSPSNIILCTEQRGVEEQVAIPEFDVRLIDLGSASTPRNQDDSFTMLSNIWRNGTPAYAAPEMLTNDLAGVEALRRNRAVDVYALCSILYELYAGRSPFSEALRLSPSPYRTKMDTPPEPLVPRCEHDQVLTDTIMAGLAIPQRERPDLYELYGRLHAWRLGIGFDEYRKDWAREEAEPQDKAATGGGLARVGDPAMSQSAIQQSPDMRLLCGEMAEQERKPEPERRRNAGISRRTLLVGAGALVLAGTSVAALSTRGFGLIDRINGIKPSLADYTWEELAALADRIATADSDEAAVKIAVRHHLLNADGTMPTGAVKQLTRADGTAANAQLIGLRHDDLADGSGKAGLTFLFADPIATRALNPEPVAAGGWEDCEARSWLNDELMERLPDDLAAVIRTVAKRTNNTGGTTDARSVTKTWDRLWLPSYVELAGTRPGTTFSKGYAFLADILNGEGEQYQLFGELGITRCDGNEALRRTFDGAGCYWWLRTPSPDVSLESGIVNFNRVGLDGNAFAYACDSSVREIREADDAGQPGVNTLMPGFCL